LWLCLALYLFILVQKPSMSISKIEKYTVYYISQNTNNHDAEISLFKSNRRIGALYFYRDETDIPADRSTLNGPQGHYRLYQFKDVLNILQTEDPVYLQFDPRRNLTYIQTAWEPVGEEET